jgi:hypothetical protein
MKNSTTGDYPSRSATKSPSWITERDAIRLFGDRKSCAILAIYHARRSARAEEFFVHPHIAKLWGLSAADLNWALDKLDGKLVETIHSKSGRYRTLRLLPQFEDTDSKASDSYPKKLPSTLVAPDEERVEIDTAKVMALLATECEAPPPLKYPW